MNPRLLRLQPYPFERLRLLFADLTPNPAYEHISLGIGEPRHATPALVTSAALRLVTSAAVHAAGSTQPANCSAGTLV